MSIPHFYSVFKDSHVGYYESNRVVDIPVSCYYVGIEHVLTILFIWVFFRLWTDTVLFAACMGKIMRKHPVASNTPCANMWCPWEGCSLCCSSINLGSRSLWYSYVFGLSFGFSTCHNQLDGQASICKEMKRGIWFLIFLRFRTLALSDNVFAYTSPFRLQSFFTVPFQLPIWRLWALAALL